MPSLISLEEMIRRLGAAPTCRCGERWGADGDLAAPTSVGVVFRCRACARELLLPAAPMDNRPAPV